MVGLTATTPCDARGTLGSQGPADRTATSHGNCHDLLSARRHPGGRSGCVQASKEKVSFIADRVNIAWPFHPCHKSLRTLHGSSWRYISNPHSAKLQISMPARMSITLTTSCVLLINTASQFDNNRTEKHSKSHESYQSVWGRGLPPDHLATQQHTASFITEHLPIHDST
jgi:hypothetical protein